MAGLFSRKGFRFLYRNDEGSLSRAAWWSGLIPLASVLVVMTIVWLLLAPWGRRGLNERAFLDPLTIVAYLYLAFYAFCVILIAVSYTYLSAKRLRTRGRYPGLAGLLPLAALFSGAAHWLYPRVAETMPWALVVACDVALIGVILWHVIDLGVLERAPGK